jgi:hypothetical protein
MIKCPSCQADTTTPAIPHDREGRRVAEYTSCNCGTRLQLSTRGGWDRWYITGTKVAGALYWENGPDHGEFYKRLAELGRA